jgi:hypothetical protein
MNGYDIGVTRAQWIKSYLSRKPLFRTALIRARAIPRLIQGIREVLHRARYCTISKTEFLNDLKTAIANKRGYAAGKIGYSEQHWMYYEILLSKQSNPDTIKQFERDLSFHGLQQEGVFPAKPNFYLEFNKFYIQHVRNINCLGICYRPWELEIIRHYKLNNKLIYYPHQQTDVTSSSTPDTCYLPHFRDKKLLLVCPFAGILMERATKEVFEGVWSKAGNKKWFYPDAIDALEFPYGFAEETHKSYSSVIDLFKYITTEIEKRDFDIALIGAGGLAIPLASHVKNMGKIGIDLGGHLQVLFGVLGKRYRNWHWDAWNTNEWCIDMPAKYRPKEADQVCDKGAYW